MEQKLVKFGHVVSELFDRTEKQKITYLSQQEAFEKRWAHSPQRAASRRFTRCRHCTVARRPRIDVHDANDDDNDNA